MALKDWKRNTHGAFNGFITKNSHDGYEEVEIETPKNSIEQKWVVVFRKDIFNYKYPSETRRRMFDTKSQALKFAKSYMEKH